MPYLQIFWDIVKANFFFWCFAILSLNLYRGYLTGKLTPALPVFYLAVPLLAVFVVVDWAFNRTFFLVVCWQLPLDWKELVTTRMTRYRKDPATNSYRRGWANFICNSLNVFNYDSDPHC